MNIEGAYGKQDLLHFIQLARNYRTWQWSTRASGINWHFLPSKMDKYVSTLLLNNSHVVFDCSDFQEFLFGEEHNPFGLLRPLAGDSAPAQHVTQYEITDWNSSAQHVT